MTGMEGKPRYLIEAFAPFPKKWRDDKGPISVMAGPVKGWLMCRRPGAVPFVLHVRQILNTEPHPHMGPFEVVGKKTRRLAPPSPDGEDNG